MTNDFKRDFGRMEGKIDSLIIDLKLLREATDGRIGKLEEKVNSLEKRQFAILAVASVASTALGLFIRKFF